MTPERIAALVSRWARLYTRGLPAHVAERRIEEIEADVHDQIAHDRARGVAERRIARGIAGRMARGMAADMTTRGTVARSLVRIALVTALVLAVPLAGTLVGGDWNWSGADFVIAGVLLTLTGLLYELAARKRGSIVFRVAAAALGAAAMVLGEADDAPGLFGFGLLVIVSTFVLALRAAPRNG